MKLHNWIDLTHLISPETIVYPGDPALIIVNKNDYPKSDFHIDEITSAMHVGTHLDSPFHFIKDGNSIDDIDINQVVGDASVVKVTVVDNVIATASIEKQYNSLEHKHPILLISTNHSELFNKNEYFLECPSFEKSIFDFVIKYRITCIGLDLPTIQYASESPKNAHLDFLGNNIIIIEGLNLLETLSSEVFFIGLPLKIKGIDGSLIRAIAKNI
ncbi:MAG: cyclase family protein [Candidatus Izemoplasmatales bacterium]|jgi:arylformamidase|nr:cyclase family protein [Candidatus Izemoplasmatales bacterium]